MLTPFRNRYVVFRNQSFPLGGPFSGTVKGYSYVCPRCGELWGTLHLSSVGDFQIITWPCDAHGDNYRVGGSFLVPLLWWDRHTGPDLATAWGKFSDLFRSHEILAKVGQLLGENTLRDYYGSTTF